MTPDLQRLCAAAQTASGHDDIELTPAECEAIVRAVLTALREPSHQALQVGGHEAIHHKFRALGSMNERSEIGGDVLRTMIDHILTP